MITVVRAGETLFSIAEQYSVEPSLLANVNGITNPSRLVVGQSIYIPGIPTAERPSLRVNGYAYPFINEQVLLACLPSLSSLTIFGYGFTAEGNLLPIDDDSLIQTAVASSVAPIMLISSLTEDGTFQDSRANLAFQNLDVQDRLIASILETMRQKGYTGLDVDFEFVRADNKESYLSFLENVTTQLNAEGYSVNVDLAPKTSATQTGLLYEAHDYAAIGAIANTVLVMTYEWGYTYGPPMAVAPLDKVKQVLDYAVTEIPLDKILMGFPNYGYDFTLPYIKGSSKANTLGNEEAVSLAYDNQTAIRWDETAASPFFNYRDSSQVTHEVWFEDVRSYQEKLNLLTSYPLLGCGIWNLMRPFAGGFTLLREQYTIEKMI